MREGLEDRARELAKRAGLSQVPPRLMLAAAVVLAIAVAFGVARWWPDDVGRYDEPADAPTALANAPSPTQPAFAAEPTTTAQVWVHVVGAVRHPGLYGLKQESRVEDGVEAAGGLLGNAAPEAVNLARKVADGEQIVIPTQDEASRGSSGAFAGTGAATGVSRGGGAAVDINSASADELDTLPGIGPATALKIVADREANGPYASVEDLGRVTGIGPKKLEGLKDLVRVK